ncbi:hypothetical protein GE061_001131 [Apolygus lucorum]|uniref:ADP-ribosylation factor-like protein 6 n=1 Tax=Apolygus lucorum TaxID=248454 RepID=A0A8S9Y884_APOLU|nr:hypothetical protein GE061_001131 [Apolygus lucorum]
MVGLNNSGKSTIVSLLKSDGDRNSEIVPTIGLNIEHFRYQQVLFTMFDMSGQGKNRYLWERYYKNCDGIIFVIDSSDRLRLAVAKEELNLLLQHPDISGRKVPILFLANKMDVREALSSVKIANAFGLEKIKDKPWHIFATSALTGEGLQNGIEWFTEQLSQSDLNN